MPISFKISKTGTRYRPRPVAAQKEIVESPKEGGAGSKSKVDDAGAGTDFTSISASSSSSRRDLSKMEVSFTLNLFPMGYFIGKPNEARSFQTLLPDGKSLHPYDRAAEALIATIGLGLIPGDVLDDIPCKYYEGTIVCEVFDYRKCMSEQGTSVSSHEAIPDIMRVGLQMSHANVIKDIASIAQDSWTYRTYLEAEATILKTMHPQLCLDPNPKLDGLCDFISPKLDLGIGRRKRLRENPQVNVTPNNQISGKKTCIASAPETSCKENDQGVGYGLMQRVHENSTTQTATNGIPSPRPTNFSHESAKSNVAASASKIQTTIGYPGVVDDRGSGSPADFTGANRKISSPQTLMGSYADIGNSNIPAKRANLEAQLVSSGGIKKPKQTPIGFDGVLKQQTGPQFSGLNGADLQWKNQLHYSSPGAQRFPHQVINNISNPESGSSFYFNQQGVKGTSKEEQVDREKLDGQEFERSKGPLQSLSTESNPFELQQPRSHHLLHQASIRNHLPPITQWHNPRPLLDTRKDDMLQKRKLVQSPRVSSGPMVHSPVSSKSGEISSGSVGGQFNAVMTSSALGSQKDKALANSNAVGAPSVTSSPNDSVHRPHQSSVTGTTAKRKANSVPKVQMSGVGSPPSVGNINAPLNANSPSIGNVPIGDQGTSIQERLAKIDAVTQRFQLNLKKGKAADFPPLKPPSRPSQELAICLLNSTAEDYIDPVQPLSRSYISGNSNAYKSRLMTFIRPDHTFQAGPSRSHHRLIMTEKPSEGLVAMQYGDTEDPDSPDSQECLIMLPSTHQADMIAAQFSLLMEHDGYQKTEDQTRSVQVRMNSSSSSGTSGMLSDNAGHEVKPEIAPGQTSNMSAQASGAGPLVSPQNISNNARLQSLPAPQSYLPVNAMQSRTQLDQSQALLQQQQNPQSQIQHQQQQHMQRSSQLLSATPLSHLMGQNANLQMTGNQMINNKATQLQIQMLQQQQQQQNQLPRKMMMGLGPMGMGNMGNNLVGLGGMGNVMGMGGVRGMSPQVGGMPGLGNMSANQMNLGGASNFGGSGLRPGSMGSMSVAHAAAIASKLRMAVNQNRSGMYSPQSGMAGMPGSTNQMLSNSSGLPMLGNSLNRANLSALQRSAMSPMGPPKIPGTNIYLSLQQQQQLQLQQQQQLQLQQLQQQQQQQQMQLQQQHQQQIGSPLQQAHVGSPPVSGSPSSMIIQQQISPQRMGQQQTSMSPQLSSGSMQQMSNMGNPGAGTGSPQQTHSPLDQLQGGNNGLNNI